MASITDENARTGAQPVVEIADIADERSPCPGTPINHSTIGFCRNCRNSVGNFYNSWSNITGSYFVPALLGSYSTTLRPTGKQKAASKGTYLEGCTIQPLSCPSPGCTDSPIGFTIVDAPAVKINFQGRDFFKLLRIELQCEVAPNRFIVVEPQIDAAPDLLTAEDSPSPSTGHTRTPKALSVEAMDIDSRPSMSQPPEHHHDQHAQHHSHEPQHKQSLQPSEINKQSLPLQTTSIQSPSIPSPMQSVAQKAPSFPPTSASPALKATYEVQRGPHPSPQISTITTAGSMRNPMSVAPQTQYTHESYQANGHQYPRSPQEIKLDAIERLQTQISQNSGALAAHTRDIRNGEESFLQLEVTLRREFQTELIRQSADMARVEEMATRLHHEMQAMRHSIETMSRELHVARVDRQPRGSTVVPQGQSFGVQDSALELMAQQMAEMSHKTAEIESLKVHVEIMKGKIYRLEGSAVPSQQHLHTFHTPRESVQASHPSRDAPTSHLGTPAMVQGKNLPQPTQIDHTHRPSLGTPSSTPAPDHTQRTEAVSQSSSWATINAGVKRTHQNGVESPQETNAHASGSPKRQKLANTDLHPGYAASQIHNTGHQQQQQQQHAELPLTDVPFQTPSHTLPSQHSMPESALVSQSPQSVFVPYATQDGPSDDSWRPESQRIIEHRPRGRGRGGGSGSRGGRVRKSMPAQLQHPLGTPDWERKDWQGVPDSQTSPDGYYSHVVAARPGRRGIARRGSGGGGTRGGYATSDRATSLGLQGVTATGMNFGSPGSDIYGSSKKTRTKPIRNADGVLIRKDGRPDMRSQSSAANLRKVHARKEGEASQSPTSFTPTNIQYATSAAPDTPSPTGEGYAVDPAASDKHNAIMGRIFPTGIDASRRQHDYARQVFDENLDQTVHPRSQNQASLSMSKGVQVKREQVEFNKIAEMQSPGHVGNGDMDMEGVHEHGGDEGQTPSEQSVIQIEGHPE